MIEKLNGIHETVKFREESIIKIYDNITNENYPLHWHLPFEVIMPIQNSYIALCNKTTFTLHEGDILIIKPAVLHQLTCPTEGRRLIIQFVLDHLNFMSDYNSLFTLLPSAFVVTPSTFPNTYSQLHSLMLEILNQSRNYSTFHELSIYSKILEMFVLIGEEASINYESHEENATFQQEYSAKFIKICSYIESHLNEPITLDQMSKMAGFSKYHFTRLFKQFTTKPFYQYVNCKRIRLAETLLNDPNITITEIAIRCGFTNTSSFNRMFRLHKECTPSEYRKNLKLCNTPQ